MATTLSLQAQNIGPVLELNAEFFDCKRNIVFATNGTGKSFLARALREVTRLAEETDNEEVVKDLLAEEGKQGRLALLKGNDLLAELKLGREGNAVKKELGANILHVFNSDYIDEELRSRRFEIEGDIQQEIIVGKENSETVAAQESKDDLDQEINNVVARISKEFSREKEQLQKKYSIYRSLGAFSRLDVSGMLNGSYRPPHYNAINAAEELGKAVTDYDSYKSLPSDPELPADIYEEFPALNLVEFSEYMSRPISLSSLADEFKQKIASKRQFYEDGLEIYETNKSQCPFCE